MGLRNRSRQFLIHPIYNLASAAITIVGILLILWPAVFDIRLSSEGLIRRLDLYLLAFFLLETLVRIVFQDRTYRRGALMLDAWAVLPIFYILAGSLFDLTDYPPGFLLLEGGRCLRLVPVIHYFQKQRQVGLRPDASRTIDGLFYRVSLIAFTFLFLGGLASSHLHSRMIESETTARTETIRRYAQTEGIQRLPFLFPDWIVRVEKEGQEGAFEVDRFDPAYVDTHFRQERDFKYIPGPDPGERIYINLKDLHKRQKLLELMILLTGFLMISALLWSCYIYANRQIVHPVERAARVAALRMAGEELDDQETILPDNEIGELIRAQNALYLEMKMPADG